MYKIKICILKINKKYVFNNSKRNNIIECDYIFLI
jgi:hypothetical protein